MTIDDILRIGIRVPIGAHRFDRDLLLRFEVVVKTALLDPAFGADLVIHSATKWLDGQGRTLGGVVVGKAELIHEIYLFCRSTGPALRPMAPASSIA